MTPAGAAVECTVVTGEPGFAALEQEWEALCAAASTSTVFQSWWLNFTAWRMSSQEVRPWIILARTSGSLVGLLPLGLQERRHGPFRWRVLGSVAPGRLDDVDLLSAPGFQLPVVQALGRFFRDMRPDWDELSLWPVREDGVLGHLREALSASMGRTVRCADASESYALDIPPGTSGWQPLVAGKPRRELSRQWRLAGQAGIELLRGSRAPAKLGALTDALVRLHARRRADHGLGSSLAAGRGPELMEELCRGAVVRGGDLWVAALGGRPVAALLTLRQRDAVTLYRMAFDSGCAALAPGVLLMNAAIADAVESGATSIDLGPGGGYHKARYSPRVVRVVRHCARAGGVTRIPAACWVAASRSSGLANLYRRVRHGLGSRQNLPEPDAA